MLAGGSASDAVEEAVKSMESDENFNSGTSFFKRCRVQSRVSMTTSTFILGYGSVLNIDGVVSMDASIMTGDNLDAGCVALVEDILHPITLARRVMEKTDHTFLGGDGDMIFAEQ